MKFALPNATSSVFALSLISLDFVSIFLLTENDSINEITAKVDANGSNELILFKFKLGILKLGKPSGISPTTFKFKRCSSKYCTSAIEERTIIKLPGIFGIHFLKTNSKKIDIKPIREVNKSVYYIFLHFVITF